MTTSGAHVINWQSFRRSSVAVSESSVRPFGSGRFIAYA